MSDTEKLIQTFYFTYTGNNVVSYPELARIILCEIEKVISALRLHLIGSVVC